MMTPFRFNLAVRVCCLLLIFLLCRIIYRQARPSTGHLLLGQWQCTSVLLVPNKQAGRIDKTLRLPRGINFKTIKTRFDTNGTFYTEYTDARNNHIARLTGRWVIVADSVVLQQFKPQMPYLNLHLNVADTATTLQGKMANDAYDSDWLIIFKKQI